jgi:hypothetical protein
LRYPESFRLKALEIVIFPDKEVLWNKYNATLMLLSRILGFTKEEEHTILEGGKVCEPSAFLAENFLRRGVSSLLHETVPAFAGRMRFPESCFFRSCCVAASRGLGKPGRFCAFTRGDYT